MTNVTEGGPEDTGGDAAHDPGDTAPEGHFHDHFSAVAGGYARYRPAYPPALFAWLAQLPHRPRRAWDCATGSGQAALGLAEHFEEVRATDASRRQLAHAAGHPRVTYVEAVAEDSGLPDGWADLITVGQAFHWFDRPRFYREARRVLAPGGALAVWTYDLFQCDPAVDRVVRRLYDGIVGDFWPPQRELVDTAYRSLAPELEAAFEPIPGPRIEMVDHWDLERVLGYLRTWSGSKRWSEAHGGADPVALVEKELAAAWGPRERRRGLRWPLTVMAGR